MGNVCSRVLEVVTDLEAILSVDVGAEIVEAMYIIGLKMNRLVLTFSMVVMVESGQSNVFIGLFELGSGVCFNFLCVFNRESGSGAS